MLRRGFSLLEVVIVVTLIAIGAAILIPALAGVNSRARAIVARDELDLILTAIKPMKARLIRHPLYISQLTTPIATNDSTNCPSGGSGPNNRSIFSNGVLWNDQNANYGPFFRSRFGATAKAKRAFILADGFGAVNDSIKRPTCCTAPMYLEISDVAEPDAVALELVRVVATGDTVDWDPPVDGVVTVRYWRSETCP